LTPRCEKGTSRYIPEVAEYEPSFLSRGRWPEGRMFPF
jgi:hypothetical protein